MKGAMKGFVKDPLSSTKQTFPYRFLREHLSDPNYAGLWVALSNEKLLAQATGIWELWQALVPLKLTKAPEVIYRFKNAKVILMVCPRCSPDEPSIQNCCCKPMELALLGGYLYATAWEGKGDLVLKPHVNLSDILQGLPMHPPVQIRHCPFCAAEVSVYLAPHQPEGHPAPAGAHPTKKETQ